MPVLSQQAYPVAVVQGNNGSTTGVPDDFQFYRYPVGHGNGFYAQLDDFTLVYRLDMIRHAGSSLENSL